jgi:2-methylcitrate dehydratase PrpD
LAADPIHRLAEHVAGVRDAALPADVVRAVKTFVLDTLGVGVAGSGDPLSGAIAGAVATWGTAGEATVWGTGQRLPAQGAALVNAFQIHCLEYDCVHEGAVVHAMATLLSAVAAHAERRGGVTGRDLIAAVTAGVDVAASLGLAARGGMTFFRPATAGAFGAAAALGSIEGLAPDALVNVFGIVLGHACGTMQAHTEGSRLLPTQIAFNARGALTALDLARAGLVGPRDVLEGPFGYFRLFEGGAWDLGPVLEDLGGVWQIARVSHKPFPTGRATHAAIDGTLELQQRHAFAAGDVARVRVTVPSLIQRLVGRPDMAAPTASYARLCIPYVVATALLRGGVDVGDFAPDRLVDPETHALSARVTVVTDENPDPNALMPQRIEVERRSGERHALELEQALGHPARPLTHEQHLAKFRRCWTYGRTALDPERGARLIALVDRLESVPDVRELFALTAPATRSTPT